MAPNSALSPKFLPFKSAPYNSLPIALTHTLTISKERISTSSISKSLYYSSTWINIVMLSLIISVHLRSQAIQWHPGSDLQTCETFLSCRPLLPAVDAYLSSAFIAIASTSAWVLVLLGFMLGMTFEFIWFIASMYSEFTFSFIVKATKLTPEVGTITRKILKAELSW